jgi:membrane-associated phospholipid phosphatase
VLFVLADVLPRVLLGRGSVRQVLRERYAPERMALVAVGLASFYLTYVSYRNLKGALPFARPELHDEALLSLDRAMAFGNDPAELLHDLLGTGAAAYVLSAVYLLFLAFVPLSLGAALVWGRSVRTGSWYVTALCLNWLLGAASYYVVPSLGPVFVQPEVFADLPDTGVSALQASLAEARLEVLADPTGAEAMAGIGAFASLHTSIVFTAALIAHRVGLPLVVRWALWAFLAGTITATAYFGWHYLVDDVAGLVLGAVSVLVADHATRRVAPLEDRPQVRSRTPAPA